MSPSSSSSSSSEDRGTIRAADILMFAWKGRAQLLGLAVAGALLGGVGSLLAPKKYETHTSFVSVGSSSIRLPSGLAGLAGAGSWLAYFAALKIGQASAVSGLDRLSVVLVVVLAALFLGESLTVWKVVGAALMVAGAVLIAR